MNFRSRPLPRRAFLAGTAAVGGALVLPATGCSPIAAPSADPAVRAAWALALRDVGLLDDGPAATTRGAHAEALAAEVRRACGTLDDGTSPPECTAAPSPLPAAPAPSDAKAVLADSRDSSTLIDALDSSGPLRDAYEIALLAAVDGGLVLGLRGLDVSWPKLVPAAVTADAADDLGRRGAAAFGDALEAEFALIYGMGVAAPRIGADYRASTATSADRHRLLRDRAITVLEAAGAPVPSGGPGYAVVDGAPDPGTDAAGFAAALEDACAQAWRRAVAETEGGMARAFALRCAGLAQAGAAVFRGDGAAALPGLPGV